MPLIGRGRRPAPEAGGGRPPQRQYNETPKIPSETKSLVEAMGRPDHGYGDWNPTFEQNSILSSAENNLGANVFTLKTANDGKFIPRAYDNWTFSDARDYALRSKRFAGPEDFNASAAAAVGAPITSPEAQQAYLQGSVRNQRVAGSAWNSGAKQTYNALQTAGQVLATGEPMVVARKNGKDIVVNLDDVMGVMGLTAEKLSTKYGRSVGDGFQAEVSAKLQAGKVQEALDMIGATEAQLRTVIKPEVNTVEGFQAPLLKDMPAWGQAATLVGAGAAGGALAQYLVAQGQQQQSASDYAAMVQAMNAY